MSKHHALIVGLGNPGEKYHDTRHNVGFLCIDAILQRYASSLFLKTHSKHPFQHATFEVESLRVSVLKPLTFMNLSAHGVMPFIRHKPVEKEHIWVVHDELDLPLGVIKHKTGGGHAGHRGVMHLCQHIGPQFHRVRLGIGRPPALEDVARHVLSSFPPDQRLTLQHMIQQSSEVIIERIKQHFLSKHEPSL